MKELIEEYGAVVIVAIFGSGLVTCMYGILNFISQNI